MGMEQVKIINEAYCFKHKRVLLEGSILKEQDAKKLEDLKSKYTKVRTGMQHWELKSQK